MHTHSPRREGLNALAAACAILAAGPALAAEATSTNAGATAAQLSELRQQMDELRQQYESRLKDLEARLNQLQQGQQTVAVPPATSPAQAADLGIVSGAQANANGFNPAISVILSGLYAGLSKNPDTWRMTGFIPSGGEIGPGKRGFSLSESEIGLSANIDHLFYGALTLAVTPDNEIEAEEAFVQTTALPQGLKLKAGRFFSGLGYLNEQHAHTWDFVDAPLAYQAFLGGQYKQEGVQARWLLPLDQFVELGAELGNGHNFPGTDRQRNGAGSTAVFAHTGGDVGDSHSWRGGISWLRAQAQGRTWDDMDNSGQAISNSFTGNSRMWIVDGVWKWAPNGNGKVTNFKLQGEYFRRTEAGAVTYDTAQANTEGDYRSTQSGWYLQGIYQFTTGWRVGLRHDRLDSGTVDWGANANANAASFIATDYRPSRDSVMLDWSPSEFSRWRLQLSNDRAREGVTDRQLFVQYQMSLGAHGAHSY